MGVNYLSVSACFLVLSFYGLQWWTELSLEKLKADRFLGNGDYSTYSGNVGPALELLLGSYTTVALLAGFALNVFITFILCLKCVFFGELYTSETRKLVERLVNYVVYKGAFLPLVISPSKFQAGLWSTWLTIICFLKMFQALGRDRLERLNASPSATPWAYFRVFSVLPLVLIIDLLWIRLCWVIYESVASSMLVLLFFEPFSILFETLQAIVVHGFQLLDIWLHHSAESNTNCKRSSILDLSGTGSLSEWKGILIRNLGFFLDMLTLLMALGHYIHIWCLRGMAFHVVDVILLMNTRALLSAIVKRVRGFIKLRTALGTLHGALPDATCEEIQAYEDECAICREPMAKAKKLSCNHLFHLACLRSWLDQGSSEVYSCPTCRKPLLVVNPEEANPRMGEASNDEQLARQISNQQNVDPTRALPNLSRNALESSGWRDAGLDSSWLHGWSHHNRDGAGPSTAVRSVGFGRVQVMMRHLAAVGETYAQTTLEDAAWNLWPMNPSHATTSASSIPAAPATSTGRYPHGGNGLHIRSTSQPANDNIANLLAMAETVREVLPHIPEELIFQDLQQTNSATVTVNNLLRM